MRASVIIPTYNGADKVLNILKALSIQTVSDFEIIFGVDGSIDNTEDILKKQNIIKNERVRIFKQTNKGRAIIRNNTAKLAKTDLLIFYDDDMFPIKKSVEKHILFHEKKQESILSANIIDKYEECNSDFLRFKSYLSKKWISQYEKDIEKLKKNNLFLSAANFSIKKDLFFKLNGFDKNLTDAEDWDFAVRSFEKGISIYFDSTNIAWHNERSSCKQYILRQRNYNKAQNKLYNIKPNLYVKYNQRNKTPKKNIGRLILYSIFANKWNVYLIDKNFYIFLPKHLRYKLYDITITGLGWLYTTKSI